MFLRLISSINRWAEVTYGYMWLRWEKEPVTVIHNPAGICQLKHRVHKPCRGRKCCCFSLQSYDWKSAVWRGRKWIWFAAAACRSEQLSQQGRDWRCVVSSSFLCNTRPIDRSLHRPQCFNFDVPLALTPAPPSGQSVVSIELKVTASDSH